jgi:glycosyltransferase involved in cell wall biosynthesis
LLLISANSAWNIVNFRSEMVAALRGAGFAVAVAAPDDGSGARLEALGATFLPFPLAATAKSPVHDLGLLARYLRLFRRHRPAAFLGFTAKANIYGSIAARWCGVPAINNVTGLGTAFLHGRRLEMLLAGLYRLAFRRSARVFFHNDEDRALFIRRGLVRPAQAQTIPGSGIDLQRFALAPPSSRPGEASVFLFIGRLLWEKGAGEFAQAAALVRHRYPKARFLMAGEVADGARAVPRAELERWCEDGVVEYLGKVGDVRPLIASADCLVLPSWREGLPRVVLEAAAIGRPAIVSDAPGCRQAVEDGVTGLLHQLRSAESLVLAMERFMAMPADRRTRMGAMARAHAEERFRVQHVCAAYLDALHEMGLFCPDGGCGPAGLAVEGSR